jgi:hypothetical protein
MSHSAIDGVIELANPASKKRFRSTNGNTSKRAQELDFSCGFIVERSTNAPNPSMTDDAMDGFRMQYWIRELRNDFWEVP